MLAGADGAISDIDESARVNHGDCGMKTDVEMKSDSDNDALPAKRETVRAAYLTPRLERLGAWSALTLQQSVPIFP
jgi:hypothetical protein